MDTIITRTPASAMAAIQLRKILTQNSKLIKGYHLLALIQMKNHEWSKARRTLKKAARIDKTNTTTLRFLREVDEQTGVTTRLEKQKKGLFHGKSSDSSGDGGVGNMMVHVPAYRENSRISLFVTLMLGVGAGVLGFWLLAVPAIRQGIYREANQQIVRYSESLASQGAELSKAQGEARESGDTAEEIAQQLETEKQNSQSYLGLLKAYAAYRQEDYDSAALEIQNVYEDALSDDVKWIYDTICEQTGVSGISDNQDEENSGSADAAGDNSDFDDSSGDDYSSDGYYDEDGDYIEY